MTTIRSGLVLGAIVSLALAALPAVSAAQSIPQRGRSSEHRLDRSDRGSAESRQRDDDRDDRYQDRRGDRDDRYEDRRDDGDDRWENRRDDRYGSYDRRDSRYGLARSCQAEYERLITNERRQEAQWYRNHGRYERNTRQHELQQQRKFERRVAQLRRRCDSVSGPWNSRADVWRSSQIPRDRNGDGRIDSRDRSDARRDQRGGNDDTWSRARRSGGS